MARDLSQRCCTSAPREIGTIIQKWLHSHKGTQLTYLLASVRKLKFYIPIAYRPYRPSITKSRNCIYQHIFNIVGCCINCDSQMLLFNKNLNLNMYQPRNIVKQTQQPCHQQPFCGVPGLKKSLTCPRRLSSTTQVTHGFRGETGWLQDVGNDNYWLVAYLPL